MDENIKKSLNLEALILEQAHIYAVKPDGAIIFWNSGSEQLYGWTKNEAMGKLAHELLKTEFPVKVADFTSRLMVADEWSGELIQYARDGARLVISSHAIVHRDNDGKPDAVIVVNNDATKLKKTEEALKQSEDKFKFIATHTPDHILIQDLNLRYTMVINPQLGLTEKGMLGKTDFEILNKEDAENLTKIKKQVIETGEPVSVDLPLVSNDGVTNYFEGSYIPRFGEDGKTDGLIGYFRNVNRRRQAEQELSKQKNELQTIIDSVPASIFYKDTQNRFLKVNNAFCELMNLPREKLEGKRLSDIYPSEQARAFWKDDREVIKTGRPKIGIIEEVRTKNGTVWAQTDKLPYRDAAGGIIGVLGFAVDITARMNAEENLKKYNRMLRAISSANQALMHAKHEQAYIDEVCAIIVKECGYKLSWIGYAENDAAKTVKPAAESGYEIGYLKKLDITWADTARGRGPTGRAIRTGKIAMSRNILTDQAFRPWRAEAIKRGYASSIALPLASDKKVFGALMLYSAEPDPFSKDEIKLLKELSIDLSYGITLIRARVKNTSAEAAIKKASTFPELNPNPVSEIGSSGRISYVNPAFKNLFPDALKDPVKHRWFKGLNSFFWALKGKKKEIITRDIQIGDRHFLQTMLYLPSDEIIRIYGIDITKRKNAEETLKKLYDEMEIKVQQRTSELIAAKHLADIGTLAATVAHELRNPLGVISVAAFNIKDRIKDRVLRRHMSIIEKKVAEGGQIINNLLVYSKMKMPQFEKTNLHKLLSTCAAAAKKNYGGKRIRLVTVLKPVKELLLDADPLQLKEVFDNLITNAFQAIESKTGIVEIRASVISGKHVIISVKDSGTGISTEDMGNLYKPFFTRKTKGTGLGLVICRDLVNMHNGAIKIKSIPGKGSVFTVTLPVRRSK